jgi:hypothetical protein
MRRRGRQLLLATLWLAGCATSSEPTPGGAQQTDASATALPEASAQPAGAPRDPKLSSRVTRTFVIPASNDRRWVTFGLAPCGDAWCTGVHSWGRPPQGRTLPRLHRVGKIDPEGLLQTDMPGPTETRRVMHLIAPARADAAPWWVFAAEEERREVVKPRSPVSSGSKRPVVTTPTGSFHPEVMRYGTVATELVAQRAGETETSPLFSMEGDTFRGFRLLNQPAAWVSANPPRGIISWHQRVGRTRRHPTDPPVEEPARNEYYLTTTSGGVGHTRPLERPAHYRERRHFQKSLVAATAKGFAMALPTYDSREVRVRWIGDDGRIIREGVAKRKDRWSLHAMALEPDGRVLLAGQLGRGGDRTIGVGGFDPTGKPLPIRQLEGTSDNARALALFRCGGATWLVRRDKHGDLLTVDALRLQDGPLEAHRLYQRSGMGLRRQLETARVACHEGEAALWAPADKDNLFIAWKAD